MKLLKNKTTVHNLKFHFKYLSGLFLTVALFAACQKNNSDNSGIATAPLVQNQLLPGNCAQCNFAQAQLIQATSQGTNSFPVTINWQLIGEQTKIQQLLAVGWNPQKTYSGAIYARGGMTIAAVQNNLSGLGNVVLAGYCQIPAGQYTLNPIQPGTMSLGSFELPQFEAIQGAVRIVFTLSQAVVIDPNGDGVVDRIAGQLVPVQAVVNGVVQSCNDIGVYIQ
jgi:hypothetical protein